MNHLKSTFLAPGRDESQDKHESVYMELPLPEAGYGYIKTDAIKSRL